MAARRRPGRGQLALAAPPDMPATYWENRGPRDWHPVAVTVRYGDTRGLPEPPFPLVRTAPLGPRNVTVVRPDGSSDVLPVRTLRRRNPGEA